MMLVGFCVFIVTVFGFRLVDGGDSKKNQEYIPIKYPGPIQEITENRYGRADDDVPEECRNQNYCTIKPPDYPQERFNEMFKGTKLLPRPTLVIENVADRTGDVDDDDNCRSTVAYDPIYKVWSNGKWHMVVQAPDKNYVQAVRTETCRKVGTPCFTALPPTADLETLCQQKYSTWQFLVATENGTQEVKTDLPICCSCRYKFI